MIPVRKKIISEKVQTLQTSARKVNNKFITFKDGKSGNGGKLKKKKTRTVFSRSQVKSTFI